MARKDDLLAEAAALGIEGLDESFRNDVIQARIDAAEAENAAATPDESAEEPAEEQAEDVAEEASDSVSDGASAPGFTLEQLKPYAESLFGVGAHVLVGAASAGFIPTEGTVTKDEVAAGIDQYLNMPVEQKKEG